MGDKYKRQESMVVEKKLLRSNMRRVLYSSAVTVVLLPIIIIVYSFMPIEDELQVTMRGFMLGYEALAVIFGVIAFLVFKSQDSGFKRIVIRSYWAFFVLFSFVMLYIDAMTKSGLFYYGIMLAVLSFIPLLSNIEAMYYFVTQAVFIVFLMIKFEMTGKAIVDITVMNLIFALLSRLEFNVQRERFLLKERLKDIRQGSSVDPLTGLYNRKGLDKRLSSELPEAIKNRRRISILMIDVDCMTQFNREFGFEQGDLCLKSMGDMIKRIVLRNTDVVCRMSGGKFLVFMSGGDDMEPVMLAEKVRSGIERQRIPFSRTGGSRIVTVSIGVASAIPRGEHSFSEVYDEADEALGQAKERGRNIIVYDEQIYGRKARRA